MSTCVFFFSQLTFDTLHFLFLFFLCLWFLELSLAQPRDYSPRLLSNPISLATQLARHFKTFPSIFKSHPSFHFLPNSHSIPFNMAFQIRVYERADSDTSLEHISPTTSKSRKPGAPPNSELVESYLSLDQQGWLRCIPVREDENYEPGAEPLVLEEYYYGASKHPYLKIIGGTDGYDNGRYYLSPSPVGDGAVGAFWWNEARPWLFDAPSHGMFLCYSPLNRGFMCSRKVGMETAEVLALAWLHLGGGNARLRAFKNGEEAEEFDRRAN